MRHRARMIEPTAFDVFIARLGDALDARAADDRPLTVSFDPARRGPAAPNEAFVGLGDWFEGERPVEHQGACLNNKGAAARFGWPRGPVTVAAFVRDAPDALVAAWRDRFPQAPGAALDAAHLVVEDASPDSVLTMVFWLARLHGVAPESLPQRWLTALTVWERDGVAPSVMRSWTALLSALSHSHFGMAMDGAGIAEAWGDALRFTVALMRAGADPDKIDPETTPAILTDQAYGRAIAFAKNEEQDYLQSLARAVRLELVVPMAGSPGRELLVDAYFATESNAPSGVKKIYIRTDTAHTSLGNGFSLMGLHRPGLEGTGNDMTVSVDPRSGINLKDLWARLEGKENERWGAARPHDNPRRIASYPHGGFDQPWWDDHGRYTLIGAPKSLAEGRPGSKLGWGDVLEAVWQSYNQLRDIEVFDLSDGTDEVTKPIADCAPRSVEAGQDSWRVVKHVLAAKWDRGGANTASLQFTQTVKRHLAAMVQNAARGQARPVRVGELGDPADYDFLELSGGAVVVTRDGAFLFDDWRDRDLGMQFLALDFSQTVSLLASCKAFDAEVDELYAATNRDTLRRITQLRARIARTFRKSDLAEASPDRRMFRKSIEARWGLDGREDALTTRLKDLQEILEAKATQDTQGMATLLAFVTIPAFIGTVLQLYGLVVQEANRKEPGSDYDLVGYGIWMFILLLALSGVAILAAWLLTRRRR